MVTIGICFKGRMQLDINDCPYQVMPNDILISPPNAYIKNAWLSPDFECNILCLSLRVVTDFIPENRLWNKINMLSAYPIIHVDNENLHIFELCMKMLKEKLRASSSKYKKEIVYLSRLTCLNCWRISIWMNRLKKNLVGKKSCSRIS